ncbi:MAG: PEF-CTERM sorting domain-containing protein, partial [Methanosarcina sp.]
ISFGEKKEALVGSTWVGGSAQIPEFPSIALPVVAILGLMFILVSRRKE